MPPYTYFLARLFDLKHVFDLWALGFEIRLVVDTSALVRRLFQQRLFPSYVSVTFAFYFVGTHPARCCFFLFCRINLNGLDFHQSRHSLACKVQGK